jgi:hypothetical protein
MSEDSVEVCVEASDKEAITVLAGVTATYAKFPLFMIPKELTLRIERIQLGNIEGHHTAHSPSGWTTKETFHPYLK